MCHLERLVRKGHSVAVRPVEVDHQRVGPQTEAQHQAGDRGFLVMGSMASHRCVLSLSESHQLYHHSCTLTISNIVTFAFFPPFAFDLLNNKLQSSFGLAFSHV